MDNDDSMMDSNPIAAEIGNFSLSGLCVNDISSSLSFINRVSINWTDSNKGGRNLNRCKFSLFFQLNLTNLNQAKSLNRAAQILDNLIEAIYSILVGDA